MVFQNTVVGIRVFINVLEVYNSILYYILSGFKPHQPYFIVKIH